MKSLWVRAMRRPFSFGGRAARFEFWITVIVAFLVVRFLTVWTFNTDWEMSVIPVAFLWMWVSLAVTARRLHDIELSAWYLLIFVPLLGFIVLLSPVLGLVHWLFGDYSTWSFLVVPLIGLFAWFYIGFKPGSLLPNRYGPP